MYDFVRIIISIEVHWSVVIYTFIYFAVSSELSLLFGSFPMLEMSLVCRSVVQAFCDQTSIDYSLVCLIYWLPIMCTEYNFCVFWDPTCWKTYAHMLAKTASIHGLHHSCCSMSFCNSWLFCISYVNVCVEKKKRFILLVWSYSCIFSPKFLFYFRTKIELFPWVTKHKHGVVYPGALVRYISEILLFLFISN